MLQITGITETVAVNTNSSPWMTVVPLLLLLLFLGTWRKHFSSFLYAKFFFLI